MWLTCQRIAFSDGERCTFLGGYLWLFLAHDKRDGGSYAPQILGDQHEDDEEDGGVIEETHDPQNLKHDAQSQRQVVEPRRKQACAQQGCAHHQEERRRQQEDMDKHVGEFKAGERCLGLGICARLQGAQRKGAFLEGQDERDASGQEGEPPGKPLRCSGQVNERQGKHDGEQRANRLEPDVP